MRKGLMRKLIALVLVLAMSVPASLADIKVARAADVPVSVTVTADKTSVSFYDDGPVLTANTNTNAPDSVTFTYKWKKKNENGSYSTITGATSDTYTIPKSDLIVGNGNSSSKYTYQCSVTTSPDYGTFSPTIEITVLPKVIKEDDLELYNGTTVFTSGSPVTKQYDGNTTVNSEVKVRIKRDIASTDTIDVPGTLAYDSATAGTRDIIFTPGELSGDVTNGNYNFGTVTSITLKNLGKIKRLTTDKPGSPELLSESSVTSSTVDLKPATNAQGYACEYAFTTGKSIEIPENAWQSGTRFTGLKRATRYYFWQRVKAGDNYEASYKCDDPLEIVTEKSSLEQAVVKLKGTYDSTNKYWYYTYNGLVQTPVIESVMFEGKPVDQDQYVVTYSRIEKGPDGTIYDNGSIEGDQIKNAGMYRVHVTARGDSGFIEGSDAYADYVIKPFDIGGNEVTAIQAGTQELFYTGRDITPEQINLIVKFQKGNMSSPQALVVDKDYTLPETCKSQPSNTTGIGVGNKNGELIITGKGNFTGTRTVSFSVKQKPIDEISSGNRMYIIKAYNLDANGKTKENIITSPSALKTNYYSKVIVESKPGYKLHEVSSSDPSAIPSVTQAVDSIIISTTGVGIKKYFYVTDTTNKYIYSVPSDSEFKKGSPKELTLNIDSTAPTGEVKVGYVDNEGGSEWSNYGWTSLKDTISTEPKWLTNRKTLDRILISADDDNAATVKKEYYIATGSSLKIKKESDLKKIPSGNYGTDGWTPYNAVSDIDYSSMPFVVENAKQIVYVRLTDAVGNCKYLSSDLIENDTLPPEFPSMVSGESNPVIEVSDITADITVKAEDSGSGVWGYKLYYSTGDESGNNNIDTVEKAEANGTRVINGDSTGVYSITGLIAGQKYYYAILSTDNAGNTVESPKKGSFQTEKDSIARAVITLKQGTAGVNNWTYTGQEIRPEIESVKLPNGTVVDSTDYEVYYADNTLTENATGKKAYVFVSASAVGHYSGKAKQEFTISPYDISRDTSHTFVTASQVGTLYYTGENQVPVLDVKFMIGDSYVPMTTGSTATITSGSGYTMATTATQPTNQGNGVGTDGSVEITGKGNFTGTKSFPFTVKQKKINPDTMYTVTVNKVGDEPGDIVSPSELGEKWYRSVVITPKTDFELYKTTSSETGSIPAGESAKLDAITLNITGEGQEANFYLRDKDGFIYAVTDDESKKGKPATIIANIDTVKPSAKLQIKGSDGSEKSTVWSSFRVITDKSEIKYITNKDDDTINITDAVDVHSGIDLDKLEYYISGVPYDSEDELAKIGKGIAGTGTDGWTVYSGSKKPFLSGNAVQIIYARITDKAGNTTYIASDKVQHDNIAPKFPEEVDKDGSMVDNPIINPKLDGVDITISATDVGGSGVDHYWIKIKATQAEINALSPDDIKYNNSGNTNGVFSISDSGVYRPNKEYFCVVLASDKAGNEKTKYFSFKTAKRSLSEATIRLDVPSSGLTYTGVNLHPTVTGIDFPDGEKVNSLGDVRLKSDDKQTWYYDNYRVKYENNKEVNAAAKVTVFASGDAQYTGEISRTFTINPYDISGENVAVTDTVTSADKNYYYTGEPVNPELQLKFRRGDNTVLEMDANSYTIAKIEQPKSGGSGANNSYGVGFDGKVTITGKGNFTGTRIYNFSVLQKQLEDSMYSVTYKPFVTSSAFVSGAFDPDTWYADVEVVPTNGYSICDGSGGVPAAENKQNLSKLPITPLSTGVQKISLYVQKDREIYAVSTAIDPTETAKQEKKGDAKQLSVKVDKDAPTGRITVGEKSWDSFVTRPTSSNPGLIVYQALPISIDGVDAHSGMSRVQYLITDVDEYIYGNMNSIEDGTPSDPATYGIRKWAEYDPDHKPALIPNKTQKICVKLTDKVGNVRYLSTEMIKNDMSLSDATVTLSKDSLEYTGAFVSPSITVVLAGKILVKDTDYKVRVSSTDDVSDDGTVTSAGKNVGEVTIEIIGINAYKKDPPDADKADKIVKYYITRKQVSAFITGRTSKIYDGSAFCSGGSVITGEPALGYEITGKHAADDVSVDTSDEKKPTLMFETSDAGEDLTVQASGVFLTGSAAKNYKLIGDTGSGGIATGSVGTIVKATPTITFTTSSYVKTYVKGGSFSVAGDATYNGDGNLKYKVTSGTDVISVDDAGVVSIKKVGTAKITVTASDGKNYKEIKETDPGKVELTVTINRSSTPPNKPGETLPVSVSVETIGDAELPAGWTWISSDAGITDAEREEAETREKAKPDFSSGTGVWFVSGATAYIPQASSNVYSVAIYETADHEEYNYVPSSCRVLINIIKADHNHKWIEVIDKDATCKEDGEGLKHIECEVCQVIKESNIVIPRLTDHAMVHHRTDPQLGVDGLEYDECKYCGERKNVTILPKLTPTPKPTKAPAPTYAPVPTSPGGGGGSGGGGGGGGSSGGGGSGGGGGGDVPVVSGSPLPGAPTIPPVISPVPTIQPSGSTQPAPTVAPTTAPASSGTVDTSVDTRKDESGNIISVTTTTTETKDDGSRSKTISTEYTDGRSTLEITKVDKNGDMTTIIQETQKNGDYVKTTTVIPADGSATTIVYAKSDKNITSVNTYQLLPDGGLQIVSSGTEMSTEKLVIPDTITSNGTSYPITTIQSKAFKGRTKMMSVVVGNRVKTIGAGAFAKTGLKSATIGTSVMKLGKNTFKNSRGLKKIVVNSVRLNSIGKNAFSGISTNAVIYITGDKKWFRKVKKMILTAGVTKGVRFKRV